MLYYFLQYLDTQYNIPGFGVFKYISFRSILALISSLIISLLIGGKIIDMLRKNLIGESIREDGPETHKKKAGTPTMGGLIIIAGIVFPVLLWADINNAYIWLSLLAIIWMGIIGFTDDYIKVFKKDKQGLKGRFKIIGQVGLGLIVGLTMISHPDFMGSRANITQLNVIKTTELLTDAGFVSGDKLLKINGFSFSQLPDASKYEKLESYTVARKEWEDGFFIMKEVTLRILEKDRYKMARELFGLEDKSLVYRTNLPLMKNYVFDYSNVWFLKGHIDSDLLGRIMYVLIAIFIVTAVSNGVNITDGIDGLAAGTSAIVGTTLGLFAYLSGNALFSNYLNITYLPLSAELIVYCAALVGACIGFLWYNTYPAQVFMGDTGSLALGGVIAVLALMVKKELLIPIMCGIFFVENLSVILQVSYFKYNKKRYGIEYAKEHRLFRMSPLHHHYEKGGMHEAKIVMRFFILGILLSALSFATLKLR